MNILDEILEYKRTVEVPALKRATPTAVMRSRAEAAPWPKANFAAALNRADGRVALIAEIKRASPSRGVFVAGDFDPVAIAREYERYGASAVSVLTDERYFKGALPFLHDVAGNVAIPALRKDFVIDAYQLYEARVAGACAALLIVAALDDALLADLHATSIALGLTPLVEVHDPDEVERALRIGASVIGVNNRSLRTFKTDLAVTGSCARALRGAPRVTLISESGIFTQEHVMQVADMGAQAVLVGESIITAPDRVSLLRQLTAVSRTVA